MARRSRAGSRRRAGEGRTSTTFEQLPFQQLQNPYQPVELLTENQIDAIHQGSLTVLEDIGINFLLPEAREILKSAGADVDPDGTRVRFDRGLIETALQTIPEDFTLHARNPAHNLKFGKNYLNISSVSSPPNASDLDQGRRSGNF